MLHQTKVYQTVFQDLTQEVQNENLFNGNLVNCCPPSNFHTPTTDGKNNTLPYFTLNPTFHAI